MSLTLLNGDCRDVLPTLAADIFDCVVTSPPYWGLRSYLPEGHADKHMEIGLEPTLDAYLDAMVGVCRELRRVLKPDGTFWLNIGDSFSNGRVLKPKDLCMVPNRLAIRLQEDGWWIRSEIIWAKPNPMPESVTDRPTSAHEKVWLIAKGERYFYDYTSISEQAVDPGVRISTKYGNAGTGVGSTTAYNENRRETRNARNVWTIASQPYSGAHFATMPPELAERCIKAGCPVGGMVLDPFGGAGTTGLVADRLGRNATLIELNPAYVGLQRDRISDDAPLFAEIAS